MRDDWLRIETIRPFLPSWLSNLMTLRVLGIITVALIILALVLRAVG